MGGSLGILDPSTDVAVLHSVSNGMVVFIICLPLNTAKKLKFLGCLELLGSGEESSNWDTGVSEGLVVGTSGESSWNVVELSILSEIILKELLDWAGSWYRRTGS